MASLWIPFEEVMRQVLEDNPDKVYPSFSDESEQEISDQHESESSDEIAKENEISSAYGDSDAEVDSNGMFLFVCLF